MFTNVRFILIFLLFCSCTRVETFFKSKKKKVTFSNETSPVKNVLVVSFCSVSPAFLPLFGKDVDPSEFPNLTRIFNSSFNFTNAYTNKTWSNTRRFIFKEGWNKKYSEIKTDLYPVQEWSFGKNGKALFARFPAKEDMTEGFNDYYNDDRLTVALRDFNTIIDEVKNRNNNSQNRMWMLHLKIMHYPYLSETYLTDQKLLKKIFNEKELGLINEYLKNPGNYPDKKPFFQAVFGRESFKKLYFNKTKQYVAYVTDVASVIKWKKSYNSDVDLSILRKSYRLRLRDFDQVVGKFLNFYETIEDNTAIVFTGDHGETLGKHDYLTHGTIPYDEVMRFFYSIHFPHQEKKVIIDKQINQKTTALIIEEVVLGKKTERNFLDTLSFRETDHFVYSSSCSGDIYALRVDSKWKLIYYISQDRYELFDLSNDPEELHDVSSENFEIAQTFKVRLLESITTRKYTDEGCIK